MDKKILLVFLAGIFLIGLVSAGDNPATIVKQGDNIQLYQFCDTCHYVTLDSVTYPNSSVVYINADMTKEGHTYNYTFSKTQDLGDYNFNVCGDRDGGYVCEVLSFKVTPNGKVIGTSDAITYGGFIFLMVGILVFMLYIIFGLSLENQKNSEGKWVNVSLEKYLKVILIALAYPVVLIILNLANTLATNMELSQFSGTIGFLFEVLMRAAWVWTFVMMLWLGYLAWKDTKIKKIMKEMWDYQ